MQKEREEVSFEVAMQLLKAPILANQQIQNRKYTVKSHDPIPLDEFTKLPDYYALVAVHWNEVTFSSIKHVDELIVLKLEEKEKLDAIEEQILKEARESIEGREKAERDAGEEL